MYLIIDIGNTRVKTALFQNDVIYRTDAFSKDKFVKKLQDISNRYSIKNTIVSAVGELTEQDRILLRKLFNYTLLDAEISLPFINDYETPKTLGVDRVALAAAAASFYPKENVLVIDAGTCITFEFVASDNKYLGGAIAPGIRSRYRSLSDYTDKLPLLTKKIPDSFIGKNTQESIHSGVINGICREIDGIIDQYKERYKKLTVVLTGGDADFLSGQLKSSIFVRPFFLLEGLYCILKFNL